MDLERAKEKVYSFFEKEFSLENFDTFLKCYENSNYKGFKQHFLEAYSNNFLNQFENSRRMMLIFAGSIKKVIEAISLDEVCTGIEICGNAVFDGGYNDEANLFYILAGEIKMDDEPVVERVEKKPAASESLEWRKEDFCINKRSDQTKSIEYYLNSVRPYWTERKVIDEINQGLSSKQ